ncbi:hypothetical protein SNEBB_008852, partial [Seison nebaliae]
KFPEIGIYNESFLSLPHEHSKLASDPA